MGPSSPFGLKIFDCITECICNCSQRPWKDAIWRCEISKGGYSTAGIIALRRSRGGDFRNFQRNSHYSTRVQRAGSPINPLLYALICLPFATPFQILSETLSSLNEIWATGIQNLQQHGTRLCDDHVNYFEPQSLKTRISDPDLIQQFYHYISRSNRSKYLKSFVFPNDAPSFLQQTDGLPFPPFSP